MKSNELFQESLRDTDLEYDWVKEERLLELRIEEAYEKGRKEMKAKFFGHASEYPNNDIPSQEEFAGQF